MRALLVLVSAALCACNYAEETPALHVQVDNVPFYSDRAVVVLTDSGGATKKYFPSYGAGSSTQIILDLAAPPTGTFSVTVQATDKDQADLADGTVSGTYQGSLVTKEVALHPSGASGTYGAPCLPSTTGTPPNICAVGLECHAYGGTDPGICTTPCTTTASCHGGVEPPPVCDPFPGTTATFCQWDCTPAVSGGPNGPCPTGLTCRPVSGASKSYCQGS